MALYSVNNTLAGTQQAMTTTFKTQTMINAITASLRRAFIFELDIGADGLPNATDCAIVWDLSATVTAVGTATALTPLALDQADAASGTAGNGNHTAEPTMTATSSRWALAANQRGTYRWVVSPGGPGEIVVPATNLVGFALRAKSTTYASTGVATIMFRE